PSGDSEEQTVTFTAEGNGVIVNMSRDGVPLVLGERTSVFEDDVGYEWRMYRFPNQELDEESADRYPSGISRVMALGGDDEILVGDITAFPGIVLDGGDGNDTIRGDYFEVDGTSPSDGEGALDVLGAQILAGAGDDRAAGSLRNDDIDGGDGHDYVLALDGDDAVNGGSGNDWLDADRGDDFVFGGDGNDKVLGGAGGDYLSGGDGNDRIYGDDETRWAVAWDGAAEAVQTYGTDFFAFGAGTPLVRFPMIREVDVEDEGEDFIDGGAGDDRLYGGGGDDTVFGGEGHDYLQGEAGDDELYGGDGDDRMWGDRWDEALKAMGSSLSHCLWESSHIPPPPTLDHFVTWLPTTMTSSSSAPAARIGSSSPEKPESIT
ncbi:calcium-binding protein, partial [Endothiovibrio diazotrophicus]